jgi:hypothetical protein
MPIGILNIMKTYSYTFKTAGELAKLIDEYFLYIEGEYHIEQKPATDKKEQTENKVWDREPAPPTFCGLALSLGFNSMQEFETYEQNGKHAKLLKRGRLRIEASYEAKLFEKPTGAIFALKSMGWNDKSEPNSSPDKSNNTLKVEITNTGPDTARNEKEVKI